MYPDVITVHVSKDLIRPCWKVETTRHSTRPLERDIYGFHHRSPHIWRIQQHPSSSRSILQRSQIHSLHQEHICSWHCKGTWPWLSLSRSWMGLSRMLQKWCQTTKRCYRRTKSYGWRSGTLLWRMAGHCRYTEMLTATSDRPPYHFAKGVKILVNPTIITAMQEANLFIKKWKAKAKERQQAVLKETVTPKDDEIPLMGYMTTILTLATNTGKKKEVWHEQYIMTIWHTWPAPQPLKHKLCALSHVIVANCKFLFQHTQPIIEDVDDKENNEDNNIEFVEKRPTASLTSVVHDTPCDTCVQYDCKCKGVLGCMCNLCNKSKSKCLKLQCKKTAASMQEVHESEDKSPGWKSLQVMVHPSSDNHFSLMGPINDKHPFNMQCTL